MDKVLHTENLKGFEIKFHTLPGVFSKQGLDSGTKLLIDHLEVKNEMVVADLGAGGGVLGIVLAKLNPNGYVHLLEDHLRAKELAWENVELNGLNNVEVFLSDLFSAVGERTYHQIYSNPPQHLGNEFLNVCSAECFKHLKPQGEVWWVMQKHLKPFAQRLLESHFGNCKIVAHGKEHVILKSKKDHGY